MMEAEEIVLDEKFGISTEEQKEILSEINGIAEKNRRLLSHNASAVKTGEKLAVDAKKSGAIFPLAFNIAAVVILLGGGLLLISLNEKKDAQVRAGGAVFNLTERALIEDIRKDTAAKIALKEQEITEISTRLAEVDAQLVRLYPSDQILNDEQLAAQNNLLSLQNSYRIDLSALREERAQILEDARSREAMLRAEFAAAQMQSSGELDSARRELALLTGEQEKIAAIDAQMAGGFASINESVQNSRFDQALQTVESLRQFNNSNSVSTSRSFQSRREFYNQALFSLETMIGEIRKSDTQNSNSANTDVDTQQRELQERNIQLEETAAGLQRTIDTLNAAISSSQTQQLSRAAELEETVSSLRAANSSLESTVTERDRTVTSLESTVAARDRSVASLEATVAERNRTITSLETEKAGLSQTVAELQAVNSTQEQEITRLNNRLNNILQAALED